MAVSSLYYSHARKRRMRNQRLAKQEQPLTHNPIREALSKILRDRNELSKKETLTEKEDEDSGS